MLKFFVVITFIFVNVDASTLTQFVHAYKNKQMQRACTLGRQLYRADNRNEDILIATGHACAEDDFIDFIGVLQQRLGETPKSRHANVYFSTLLLKKRLISQYMHEDIDLKYYTLPLTDHVLSKVFEAIKNTEFTLITQDPKHLRIGDKNDYIDVYVKEKVYVDEYINGKKIRGHRYR